MHFHAKPPPLRRGQPLHQQSHIGPRRLAQRPRLADDQPEGSPLFRRELQPAERTIIEPVRPGQHGGDSGAIQSLQNRPFLIAAMGWMREHDISRPVCSSALQRGRRIKTPSGIDNHKQLLFLGRLSTDPPGQSPGEHRRPAPFFAQPFDERPASKASLQQPIKRGIARSHPQFPFRLPRGQLLLRVRQLLLQFLLQGQDELPG